MQSTFQSNYYDMNEMREAEKGRARHCHSCFGAVRIIGVAEVIAEQGAPPVRGAAPAAQRCCMLVGCPSRRGEVGVCAVRKQLSAWVSRSRARRRAAPHGRAGDRGSKQWGGIRCCAGREGRKKMKLGSGATRQMKEWQKGPRAGKAVQAQGRNRGPNDVFANTGSGMRKGRFHRGREGWHGGMRHAGWSASVVCVLCVYVRVVCGRMRPRS